MSNKQKTVKLYRDRVCVNNDVTCIDINDRFLISGPTKEFGLSTKNKNLSFVPLHNEIPFDKNDLVDIYCGYDSVYYVTKYDIYYCVAENNYCIKKIVLPNGIILSPSVYVKTIVTGIKHSIIFLNNNKLLAVGSNEFGQLGMDSSMTQIVNPVLVDMDQFSGKIIDVVCGYNHTLILTDNGTVYCTGKNTEFQIGADDCGDIFGFQKVSVHVVLSNRLCESSFKIVKMAASSHNSFLLSEDGILYGTGVGKFNCIGKQENKIFKPVEPFYESNMFVKDVWCSSLVTFVQLSDGNIYIAGYNYLGATFMPHVNIDEYFKIFTKNDFLSNINIKYLCGRYSLLAIDLDNNVYVSGRNDHRQLLNTADKTIPGEQQKNITNIVNKYLYYDINIQSGYDTCSLVFRSKDRYTADLCHMVCNLYEFIFGDKKSFSDISFI